MARTESAAKTVDKANGRIYMVTRKINDTMNGLELMPGTIVQTLEEPWIERFGSAFDPLSKLPKSVDVDKVQIITGTVEANPPVDKTEASSEENPGGDGNQQKRTFGRAKAPAGDG